MAQDTVTVNMPKTDNAHDTSTTALGMIEASALAVGDVLLHPGPDGVNWKAPTFWVILLIAVLRGINGYLTNKGANTQVVTKQTGAGSVVNVETTTPPAS